MELRAERSVTLGGGGGGLSFCLILYNQGHWINDLTYLTGGITQNSQAVPSSHLTQFNELFNVNYQPRSQKFMNWDMKKTLALIVSL